MTLQERDEDSSAVSEPGFLDREIHIPIPEVSRRTVLKGALGGTIFVLAGGGAVALAAKINSILNPDIDWASFEEATAQENAKRADETYSDFKGLRVEVEDMSAPANCADWIWEQMNRNGQPIKVLRQPTAIGVYEAYKNSKDAQRMFEDISDKNDLNDGDFIFLPAPYGKYVDSNDKQTKYAGHTGIATGAYRTRDLLDSNGKKIGEVREFEMRDQNYDLRSPVDTHWFPVSDIAGILRSKLLGVPNYGNYQILDPNSDAIINPPYKRAVTSDVSSPSLSPEVTQPPADTNEMIDRIFAEIPSDPEQAAKFISLRDWLKVLNSSQTRDAFPTDRFTGAKALDCEIENFSDFAPQIPNILSGGTSDTSLKVKFIMYDSEAWQGGGYFGWKLNGEIELTGISIKDQPVSQFGKYSSADRISYEASGHGAREDIDTSLGTATESAINKWIFSPVKTAFPNFSPAEAGQIVVGINPDQTTSIDDGNGVFNDNPNGGNIHTIIVPFNVGGVVGSIGATIPGFLNNSGAINPIDGTVGFAYAKVPPPTD